jgi:hypothetical protein
VALIAIETATDDRRAWKEAIRSRYKQRHPKCGSIFLFVILPILVSLISQWLGKWLFKETPTMLATMKAEATMSLGSA